MPKHKKNHIVIADDEPIDIESTTYFELSDDEDTKIEKKNKINMINKQNEISQNKRLLYDIFARRIFDLNGEEVNTCFCIFKTQYAVIDNLLDQSLDSEYIYNSMKRFMIKLFRNPGMHPSLVMNEISKIRGLYCNNCNNYKKLTNCSCK